MATWQDGPEYAPWQRPDSFAGPPATPLQVIAATDSPTAAPVERPRFDQPDAPVAPLAALVPPVEHPRDPSTPFEVVTSTVTGSAWEAVHWSASAGPAQLPPAHVGVPTPAPAGVSGPFGPSVPQLQPEPQPLAPAPAPYGAPSTPPWPEPQQPIATQSGTVVGPTGFPAPGTAQWFTPAPPMQQPYQRQLPVTAGRITTALTPGLLIVLGIGCFIPPAAPISLCIAAALVSRVQAAQVRVRQILRIAVTLLVVIGALTALGSGNGFGQWWAGLGTWALLGSWIALVACVVVVYRELKDPTASPPAGSWR